MFHVQKGKKSLAQDQRAEIRAPVLAFQQEDGALGPVQHKTSCHLL
jgi:hypothetical protein